jgi:hypothetical protein
VISWFFDWLILSIHYFLISGFLTLNFCSSRKAHVAHVTV